MTNPIRKFRLSAVLAGAALVISAVAAQPAVAEDSLYVRDFVLTNGVADREPVDSIQSSVVNGDQVYVHARINNSGDPTTVRVVWLYEGERHATVPLEVGTSSGWRTWSSANLHPGQWRVELQDPYGSVLTQKSFTVGSQMYGQREDSGYDYRNVSSSPDPADRRFYPMP